jgi:enamine deaminase RidA (YjgF/YER057c/UK114 family)
MARDIIRTPNAPSPPPAYSQAVRAAGLVFVSGTGPHDVRIPGMRVSIAAIAET